VIQKWFATGEAISHLRYLEEEGRVKKEEGRGEKGEGSQKTRYKLAL